ncbi:MAG: CHAT domain-containing protein [Bacteroidia bacterium]|nr:CHAT domain-containing protein [Bacteroidia bacterium]MDW8346166.1 CHAT domain-containing tetratricopeptide repeat protein [Bacteroidia bacterium]
MKIFFWWILVVLGWSCIAQTWQSAYDSIEKYQKKLDYPKSAQWATTTLKLYQKQVQTKDTNYSKILNKLIEAYFYMDDYDNAELYAKQDSAWNITSKNLKRYTESLYNLAYIYKSKTRYLEAQRLLESSIVKSIETHGKSSDIYADICQNLAEIYTTQGLYHKAEALMKESLQIKINLYGKSHPDYAHALQGIGKLYESQGKYAEAEVYFKEVMLVFEKTIGKMSREYVSACDELARLYQRQGRYEEAKILFHQSLDILRSMNEKSSIFYSVACNNLGGLYYDLSCYTKAESLLTEALQIQYKLLGEDNPEYATTSANLANLYASQKKYDKAEKLLKKAVEIRLKATGKEDPYYPILCNNLARLYQQQKRYLEAESLYKEAIQVIISTFGETYPYYTSILTNLAKMYYQKYEYGKAQSIYKQVSEIKMKEIQEHFKNLSEVEKEQYIKTNVEQYVNDFQCFVLKRYNDQPAITKEGYNLILQTKGLILNSTEKIKHRILQSNDSELQNLYLTWKSIKEKYIQSQSLSIEERKKRNIHLDSLYQKANEIEKQLSMKSHDFADAFEHSPPQWTQVQDELKDHQASIEITRITEKDSIYYLVFVIKKRSAYPQLIILKNGDSLEKEYYINYKRSIVHKIYDGYSYDAYWTPILKALNGIKSVFISTDGVYNRINISTLQNPRTQRYVLDEIQIIYVTKTSDLIKNKPTYSPYLKSYFVGNPRYFTGRYIKGNEKPESRWELDDLPPLKGAEKEVCQLSLWVSNSYVSIGYDATEEYVKSIKNPRILHIATHGYFKKGQYQSSVQAMLNAGVLLAGVVDYDRMEIRPLGEQDGKLTAFEVMNMELDSTELVVLSACETGLGQASREGVYGLQRAFKVAGAQSIIMSLWKVNDEATQLLMAIFYQNWQQKGFSKRKAFELAQKELRKKYSQPYYWGAFIMIE